MRKKYGAVANFWGPDNFRNCLATWQGRAFLRKGSGYLPSVILVVSFLAGKKLAKKSGAGKFSASIAYLEKADPRFGGVTGRGYLQIASNLDFGG